MNNKRPALTLVMAGFLALAPAVPAFADAARLLSVQPVVHSAELEVLIQMEGDFQHTFFELKDPSRLVVDFTPVGEVTASSLITVNAFGVERIRTGQPEQGRARVVFEFKDQMPFYLINKTPEGIQVFFLSGSAGKRAAGPNPPPRQPQLPAEDTAPSSALPSSAKADRLPRTLVGFNLANATLADRRFQEVFGHRTTSCLAANFTQICFDFGRLALAVEAEYGRLLLEGQSTITHQATHLNLQSLSLGPCLFLRAGIFWPYASAGLAVYQYHEKSPMHNTLGNSLGFRFQGGISVGAPSFDLLRARVFFQWSKAVAEENGIKVNLGGISIGAGLALAFNLF